MKILKYPDIEVSCDPTRLPFTDAVKNIWNGYRTCYSKSFNYNTDTVPKDPEKLISEIADDAVKANKLLKTVKDRFGYSELEPFDESGAEFLDLEESFQRKFTEICVSQSARNPEYLKAANACKWIAPKLKQGHESPFEHGYLTFTVKNCSRSMTHQLVRHRIASYSQASQRYISEKPDSLSFVIPASIQDNPEALAIVQKHLDGIGTVITGLKILGIKNEDIRCIYPNAMPTDIQVTMNFRELRHFIQLRLSKHSQDEIRHTAWLLLTYMCRHMPFVWSDIELDI